MSEHTRRTVLGGAAAATAAAFAAAVPTRPAAAAVSPAGLVTVGRDDDRYRSLVDRGYNRRFTGRPEHVQLVGSTRDVVRVVEAAVRAGKRIAVRGGGHGFENVVDDPAVRVVIDLTGMAAVYHDPDRRALAVEAGATLGEVYRRLYLGWGVTIPAGTNPHVGVGGHVQGAGYGALSRLHGLTVDHLYAVEVVVVDDAGKAHVVVATREPTDPNRDLWWAHTGGGGGNFGVLTRYWFRTPGARGSDPTGLLPRPPASVLSFQVDWPWPKDDERSDERQTFTNLVRNYGRWAQRNAAPDTSAAALYGELALPSRPSETISMFGQVAADDGADRPLRDLVTTVSHGLPGRPTVTTRTIPWLRAATEGLTNEPGPIYRLKIKSGYPRRPFTEQQTDALYRHLTRTDVDHPGGLVSVNTYGGQVNRVAPTATAMPHRDSIFVLAYLVGWLDEAADASQLSWMRELYRDVYADTGGVPADDGTFINYPDIDLLDPDLNASTTPWHELYYKGSYRRLQRVKSRWDPRNVFHHTLSIRPR